MKIVKSEGPTRPEDAARWFRVSAWVLLFVFWGVLIYRQSTHPFLTTIWQPPLPVPREAGTGPARGASERVEPAPETKWEPSAAEQQALARARRGAAAALLAGDRQAAISAVREERSDRHSGELNKALAELQAFVTQAAAIDEQVAAVFADSVGTEITVEFAGEPRRIVPRAIGGMNVSALLVRGHGEERRTTPVSFVIAELSPAEKNRQLGTPQTHVSRVMHLLLCVQAGDRDTAKAMARLCGPMADAFLQQL